MRHRNNRPMGKRSRSTATRRKRRLDLEKSADKRRLINLRAGAFCVFAAMLSENQGPSIVITWMNQYCCLAEDEAAESIAIGRRMLERVRLKPSA
jgi:hypothetical protein